MSFILTTFFVGCKETTGIFKSKNNIIHPIIGEWIRMSQSGPVRLAIKENGRIETDFNNDQSIEIVSKYDVLNDTIIIMDIQGGMCGRTGKYALNIGDVYIAFDVIDDYCNSRVKMLMGIWTQLRSDIIIDSLSMAISNSPDPALLLKRARVNLALGNSEVAKIDLDQYVEFDSTDARVFINRAGAKFPFDLEGILMDCNKAISLDPSQKNAYFLRGLALYDLGEVEKACADFKKAIDLGFEILEYAERNKCAEYWN